MAGRRSFVMRHFFLVFAFSVFLSVPAVAQAAAVFSDEVPAPGSVSDDPQPSISVVADDDFDLLPYPEVWVDGVAVNCSFSYEVVGGHWENDGCDSYWVTDYDYTKGTISAKAPPLSDGTHRIDVSISNEVGVRSYHSWTFESGIPPRLEQPAPAPGSTVATTGPVVSARVIESHPRQFEVLVDGGPVPYVFDGEFLSAQLSGIANDESHEVTFTVVDEGGRSVSIRTDLFVMIYDAMPVPASVSECVDCHPGYVDPKHPVDNCDGCHGYDSPVGGWYEGEAHPSSWVDGEEVALACTYCHGSKYSSVPPLHGYPQQGYHRSTTTDCGPCHVRSLPIEHYRREQDSDGRLDCYTCHANPDPAVMAAIAAGDTRCSSCHAIESVADHPYVPGAHQSTIDSETLTGTYSTGGSYGPVPCDDCHLVELSPEHERQTSSSDAHDCAACHPSPRDTLSPWEGGCVQSGCHPPASSTEMHASIDTSHTPLAINADCLECHGPADLGAMHSNASTVTAGETRISCLVCHSTGGMPVADCVACHPEKVDPHGYDAAMHTAEVSTHTVSGILYDINGTAWLFHDGKTMTYDGQTCGYCHLMDLADEHGKPSSSVASQECAACHASPRDSFTDWNKTCQQGDCHPSYHTDMSSKHYHTDYDRAGYYSTCGLGEIECHPTWPKNDMAAVHDYYWYECVTGYANYPTRYTSPRNGCYSCHDSASSVPVWTGKCEQCHDSQTFVHP